MSSLLDAPLELRRQLATVMLEIQRQRELRPEAPVLIDFFSCQGSSSYGYHLAGFIVVGVDIEPQPNYPFPMIVADAVKWARLIIEFLRPAAIAGSPPCQFGSRLRSRTGLDYEELITPFREKILPLGLPYVIENVESTATRRILIAPVLLCGSLSQPHPIVDGLLMSRHRLFETNWGLGQPISHGADGVARSCLCSWGLDRHLWRGFINVHGGGASREGKNADGSRRYHGNKASAPEARLLLGVDWMTRDGMSQAVPWRYTERIGRQLIEHLGNLEAA